MFSTDEIDFPWQLDFGIRSLFLLSCKFEFLCYVLRNRSYLVMFPVFPVDQIRNYPSDVMELISNMTAH